MKFINLVDGFKTQNGYTFSDYSVPRKPNMGSTADYMASTYTGEYIQWRDESKPVVETVLDYLNEEVHYKNTEGADALDFFRQTENVHWEYDEENQAFYSVWIKTHKPTGDAFKIESIKDVQEGQKYSEGSPVVF